MDRPALMAGIKTLARRAGGLIMRHYARDGQRVDHKVDGSPVTEADRQAHACIVEGLEGLSPAVPVLSEEGAIPAFETRREWSHHWLVDPLDGTKEFIKKNGEFTVNIALIEADVPVLGVVFAPALDILYFAGRGEGSWKQRGGKEPERIYSKPPRRGEPLVVVESRSHPSPSLERLMAALAVKERIQMGSSLKFGLVAEGRAHIYPRLGPTMEWDCAAGDCVYRYSAESGSHETRLRYNTESLRNEGFVLGMPDLLPAA